MHLKWFKLLYTLHLSLFSFFSDGNWWCKVNKSFWRMRINALECGNLFFFFQMYCAAQSLHKMTLCVYINHTSVVSCALLVFVWVSSWFSGFLQPPKKCWYVGCKLLWLGLSVCVCVVLWDKWHPIQEKLEIYRQPEDEWMIITSMVSNKQYCFRSSLLQVLSSR